jgi:WD40 repeat protein
MVQPSNRPVFPSLPRFRVACLSLAFLANGCTHHHHEEPLGPHPVDFVYWNPSAKNVFLAGSFNGWNTTSTPMHRTQGDEWQAQVTLKPGHHEYKFIADGHWTQDPANIDSASDLFGGKNSVITVNPAAHQDGEAERRSISAAVHRLLEAQNFSALEKQADDLRQRKTRLRQGRWELQVFYDGVNGALYAGDDPAKWRDAFAKLDAWHRQYPQSITEPVARAHTLVGYGWSARGSGWSSEVSDAGWRLMNERLKQARDALEASAKLPQRCPEWYCAMQAIALGQGWKRDEYDRLFEEAVAREPSYYDYYFNKAYYLAPRWFGRSGEWERFAEDAASRYDKKEGLTLYARIAWSKDFLFGNIFRESAIEWPKMRDGFLDIMKQWPDSAWNRNNFCRLACTAGDHATAARLFRELGEDLDYDVWHSRNQFQAASRWARADANSPSVQPAHRLSSRYATRATALASAPEEKRYYAGYGDGFLGRWDREAGRETEKIADFDSGILQIAVAPGGKLIAAALDDKNEKSGAVKIIDPVTGAEKATIGDWNGAPLALAFSGDGSTLVAVGGRSGQPGVAKVWDARTGTATPVSWPPPKHLLIAVALSPDGRLLMTNDDSNVRVWDLRDKKFVFRMEKDTAELVQGVGFSPDGKLAVAACARDSWQSDAPGLLLVWNTSDWTELKRIPLDYGAKNIAFSPDGRYLAATRRDNTITIWSTLDWNAATEFLPMGGYISALTYSPDSKNLAAATFGDGFSIWQLPAEHR